MRAQNVSQSRVDQVRAGVVADDARAALGVGDNGEAIAHAQRFLGYHFVRDQPRDGVERAFHFGEFQGFGVVVEPPGVRHLPAGFGVDGRTVEHNFAALTRLQLLDGSIFRNHCLDAGILCLRPKIKARLRLEGLRQLRIRGIRRLLRPALPRRTRPLFLFLHRTVEGLLIEFNARVASEVDHKIQRETVSIIEAERRVSMHGEFVSEVPATKEGLGALIAEFFFYKGKK